MYERTEPRQQPGYACEECRKKKLRCDRQRPQCGACAHAQIHCEVNNRRAPRGPKKGSMGALRNRIVALERRLSTSQTEDGSTVDGHELEPAGESSAKENDTKQLPLPNWDISQQGQPSNISNPLAWCLQGVTPHSPLVFPDMSIIPPVATPYPSPKASPASTSDSITTDLTKADLMQLYFDRVHPIAPILNKAKVLRWMMDGSATNEPRKCLQYAMWTSATAFSSQFSSTQDTLYAKTRSMLDQLDLNGNDSPVCHIEHLQAWILITFYEFARTNYRRGWLSAGRVFRLVQFLKLYELDRPRHLGLEIVDDHITLEEKRRTFWVAYCLDRFISVSEGAPMTLNEEVVFTRLPCLDDDFQRGFVPQEFFLAEAISSAEMRPYAPLAECVILTTICSRGLSQKQICTIDTMYSDAPVDFAPGHEWLYGMLTQRLSSLQVNHPLLTVAGNPMIIYSYMVAHSTIIYLCRTMEMGLTNGQDHPLVWEYQERGLWSAQEIARLAKEHGYLGYLKAHTFMPLTIYLSVSRLRMYLEGRKGELERSKVEDIERSLHAGLEALQKLQAVNNLASYYLQLL